MHARDTNVTKRIHHCDKSELKVGITQTLVYGPAMFV